MAKSEQYLARRAGSYVVSLNEFTVIADHELRRAVRSGEFLSILWLRVDRRGPVALEAAPIDREELRALGELVALELRSQDVVAVLDSNDLAVLLPDTAPEQVGVVLEHLQASVLEFNEKGRIGLVARVGAATCTPEDQIREAALLMERARESLEWSLPHGS